MNESIANARARTLTQSRLIGILIVLVAIIFAFVIYIDQTHKMVIAQNEQYAQTTTDQMARRLNEFFDDSQTCLNMAANVFENTLTSPEVNSSTLHNLANDTMFENALFASPDGRVLNDEGELSDIMEREYIDKGMMGDSGIDVIIGSEIFGGQNLVLFYEPLRFEERIIGVLGAIYTEETLSREVSTVFFGNPASNFLCQSNGEIIATSDPRFEGTKNIFELTDYLDGDVTGYTPNADNLRRVFEGGSSDIFRFSSDNGNGCGYATKLANYDLIVLSAFPIAVTNEIASASNALGVSLMAAVIVILGIYIIFVMLQGRRQRRLLREENRHISSVVEASTNLFKRFAVFDFQEMTYRYFKAEDVNKAIPMEGPYSLFRDYWTSTAQVPEEHEMMLNALDPETIRKNLTLEVPFLRYEFRSTTEALGTRWLQVSIICMERDNDLVPIKMLYAVQDVTEIKQKEERTRKALEDAYEAAEHASQAKTSFLSSMSHDIRTPMNTIMGLTAIASMNINDPNRVRDCLTKINTANKHLLGLINEVLDMAKIESGNISLSEESFDLSDVVDDVMLIVRPQVENRHQNLEIDISNITHEHVLGDPMRLKQVFLNLLGNSVKFTPEGGTIKFGMTEMPSNLQGYGCYRFTFSDTGCGISMEFQEHLFEPFTREEDLRVSKIEGTGLGLPIVKSIVELMNGTIDVESEIDEGTTFNVVVYMKTVDEATEDIRPLAGLEVLICDDDEAACEGACAMLEAIGMKAQYVTSGEEALKLIEQRDAEGNAFKAVITDWKMPGTDGMEVAREIRSSSSPDLPIVLASSYDWTEIEDEARNVGVSIFLSKPMFKSRLVHAMRKAVVGEDEQKSADTNALSQCDLTGKRILLVDDNELAAEVAMDLLSVTNAEIDHSVNGQEAYERMLAVEPGYYDIILMDVQMPIMNGHEASRAIRAAAEEKDRPDLAKIPIIALTADAFSDDVEKARAAGMNAHMSKPIDLNALARVLGEWIH